LGKYFKKNSKFDDRYNPKYAAVIESLDDGVGVLVQSLNGKLELYNLKDDASEKNDLSVKIKSKTKELHQLLINWRKQVNAQMPLLNLLYQSK